jgi:hypothetical protein
MKLSLPTMWLRTLTLMLVLHLGASVTLAQDFVDGTDGQAIAEGFVGDSEETPVGTPVNAAQLTRVDNLAAAVTATGGTQTAAEIEAMRADGMGWGDIAHALGVHPSTLGVGQKLGHSRPDSGPEHAQAHATARSMTGKAKGHANQDGGIGGIGAQKSNAAKGNAQGGITGSNSGANSGKGGSNNGGNSGKR